MLLTSRQVGEKLGVRSEYVAKLALEGKIPTVNTGRVTPSGRVNYAFDSVVIREYAKTFVAPKPKVRKVKPNGHAHDTLPLDIPSTVQLFNYLTATRVELGTRLGIIEERIAKLMAAWGIE